MHLTRNHDIIARAHADTLPLWAWAGEGGFDVAEDFVWLRDNHPKAYDRIGRPLDGMDE